MSALYEGCWHKLDRAKKHLDELQSGVGAWTNPHVEPPYTFGAEFDAKRDCFIFRVESVKAFPVEWGLIAGDVLTNLRASLDYLAYDPVGRGATPWRRDEPRTRTFFPISMKKVDFKGHVNGGMPGVLPKHRAIVQKYQPYRWGGARHRHHPALLHNFVNRDKHREIQPIVTHNLNFRRARTGVRQGFRNRAHRAGPHLPRTPQVGHPLRTGHRSPRVYGKQIGPDPYVKMGFYGGVGIAFEDARAWFPDALEGMGQMITMLFSEIEPTL
jgi:hypothetical protein